MSITLFISRILILRSKLSYISDREIFNLYSSKSNLSNMLNAYSNNEKQKSAWALAKDCLSSKMNNFYAWVSNWNLVIDYFRLALIWSKWFDRIK